jgi:hypothetical protein
MKRSLLLAISIPALCVLSACGGGNSGGGGGTEPPPAAANIYLVEDLFAPTPSNIVEFPTSSNGDVTPTTTIKGQSDTFFTGLAVDATGNVYVGVAPDNPPLGSTSGIAVLAFAPGDSGTATPKRMITGSATGLNISGQISIGALATDSVGNLYVSALTPEGQGISVFSSAANGNAAPTKVIAGSATNIADPVQIAVDSAGNIYAANSGTFGPPSILLFDSSATGNVTPTSILGGPATTINSVQGLAVDSAGNIYVAVNGKELDGGTPSILEFSAGSTGNVAPIRTISGTATMIGETTNIAVDSAGNAYIFQVIGILKFASSANGNAAPTAIITGTLAGGNFIAVH